MNGYRFWHAEMRQSRGLYKSREDLPLPADLVKAYAEWEKAGAEIWHKKWCGCKEWNGTEIIFKKVKEA